MNKQSDDLEINDDDLIIDDQQLSDVEISDKAIEDEDKKLKGAKKKAKKESKKNLSTEDKKKNRRKRDFIIAGTTLVIVIILLLIPVTRWPILNTVGFRADLSFSVKAKDSNKPILKATIILEDGSEASTDSSGNAKIPGAKLGNHEVVINKSGYGAVTKQVVNGFGNTKTEDIKLKIIGIKLDVIALHWLSGDPINGATVSFQKSTAVSDKTGLASIIIPPTDSEKVKLDISAPGFATKQIETEVDVPSREVSLISDQKDYFISKRDGKLDIFTSDLDGQNQKKIIEATGKESESLVQFSINRNNQQAILVANRDGKVVGNRIVAGIYLVDLGKSTLKKIDEGSDVQLLDWADDTMAYTKSDANLKYDDPSMSKLMAYNLPKSRLNEVSSTNYFSLSLVAGSKIFYLPSDGYRAVEGSVVTSFDVNSSAKRTYLDGKRISYATHAKYDILELQDQDGKNYELNVNSGAIKNIDRQPADNIYFALRPGGGQVLWTDKRDGQGALITKSVNANDEKTVTKYGGMTYPVRYISDSLAIFRVVTSAETADYIVHLPSAKMTKIVDVSNVGIISYSM